MQVERYMGRKLASLMTSGGRVSNAWESGLWRGITTGKHGHRVESRDESVGPSGHMP